MKEYIKAIEELREKAFENQKASGKMLDKYSEVYFKGRQKALTDVLDLIKAYEGGNKT